MKRKYRPTPSKEAYYIVIFETPDEFRYRFFKPDDFNTNIKELEELKYGVKKIYVYISKNAEPVIDNAVMRLTSVKKGMSKRKVPEVLSELEKMLGI